MYENWVSDSFSKNWTSVRRVVAHSSTCNQTSASYICPNCRQPVPKSVSIAQIRRTMSIMIIDIMMMMTLVQIYMHQTSSTMTTTTTAMTLTMTSTRATATISPRWRMRGVGDGCRPEAETCAAGSRS